jgi:hypothetical protein
VILPDPALESEVQFSSAVASAERNVSGGVALKTAVCFASSRDNDALRSAPSGPSVSQYCPHSSLTYGPPPSSSSHTYPTLHTAASIYLRKLPSPFPEPYLSCKHTCEPSPSWEVAVDGFQFCEFWGVNSILVGEKSCGVHVVYSCRG